MQKRLALGVMLMALVGGLFIRPPVTMSDTQPPFAPFPPDLQAKLQGIVDKGLADSNTPGAIVGVWIPGRGTWVHTSGLGDIASGAPIRTSDKVRIASITKTFTATAILQLVDEGKLRLDDRLDQYVPGFPYGDQITIRQVVAMTAGIYSYTDDPAFLAEYNRNPLMPFTPQDGIAIARPGEGFHYSDTNYVILGMIIEQVTGQSVGEVIEQRVVRPLGLRGTSFPTTPEMPAPHAHGYDAAAGSTMLEDFTRSNPGTAGAAGAMVSTLDDLRLWATALATGALLSPATQRERLTWSTLRSTPVEVLYGLGIFSEAGFIGHNGGIAGYSSWMGHLPEANATIVVLVNKSGVEGGAADMIALEIAKLLFPDRFSVQ